MKKINILAIVLQLFFGGLNGQIMSLSDCKTQSPFISIANLDPKYGGFSTSERRLQGLVYLQYDPSMTKVLNYMQHPSWKAAGSMGPLLVDEKGAIWVAPVPTINVLNNKLIDQNKLYRVDPKTGLMKLAIDFKAPDKYGEVNPFGLLGLAYDCKTTRIYATSVMGSTKDTINGKIYSVQVSDSMVFIIDTFKGIDAMGVGVASVEGKTRVFIGDARSGDIFSLGIDVNGKFLGSLRKECSLHELGLRGDDVPRKIRFQGTDKMVVNGVGFYFNLIGPQEKQESVYTFRFKLGKWVFESVN